MTLQEAIKLLEEEYEKAKDLRMVYDPLSYSLYKVWRIACGKGKNSDDQS